MQTLTAELDQIANLISEVHVRDLRLSPTTWEYVFIGKGQVDWSVLMRALWDHGYRGPLTIEHHIPAPNKEAATCHTAHFLKQQIPQMKNA
jgi:sugar phosphate isomerase/epimerase